MSKKRNKSLTVTIAFIVCCAILWFLITMYVGKRYYPTDASPATDTSWVNQIHKDTIPKMVDSKVIGYKKIKNADGVRVAPHCRERNEGKPPDSSSFAEDSTSVVVPIMQKTYGDSTYTAWVSGYDARLDSIRINIRSPVITKTVVKNEKPRFRFTWGIQTGYGITPKGMQPYVGIGIQFGFHK